MSTSASYMRYYYKTPKGHISKIYNAQRASLVTTLLKALNGGLLYK